jgi:crotonobetainyl-CoA:carnitine CoA-transferase CaiB-like acyl-CoA transferase
MVSCEPMADGRGVRSFAALQNVGVLELGSTLRVSYCGALLAQLGADVVTMGSKREKAEGAIEHFGHRILDAPKRSAPDIEHALAMLGPGRHVLISDEPCPPTLRPEIAVQVRVDAHDASSREAMRDVPGDALTASALAAASHAIGHADREPLPVPEEFVEHSCGLHGAIATMLALMRGQARSQAAVSMDECLRFYVGMNAKMYENYPREWRREGRRSAGSAGLYPVGMFPCSDGYVVIVARTPADWHAILGAMGSPSWAERPGWDDPMVVSQHHADEADGLLEGWLGGMSCELAVQLGARHGFAIARMLDPLEAITTEQMYARDFTRRGVDGSGVEVALKLPVIVHRGRTTTKRAPLIVNEGPVTTMLAGVRVLDLSWVWSGPAMTMMLAALGAEVVKVENSLRPDASRLRGRPAIDGVPVPGPELEVTPYFHQMNAGKLSVELDLASAVGREQILALARRADVVVENMRPGVLDRHGLGYNSLAEVNPSLVMLSMSLAGQEGPLRDAKGYASIMSALSGLESLVGYGPDEITGMLTVAVGDPNAASYGVLCVLAALMERERTGRGAWLDLSQMEAVACGLFGTLGAFAVGEKGAWGYGNWHSRHAPHGVFPTSDGGWVALSVRDDAEWSVFLEALGVTSSAELLDPRFRDGEVRRSEREQLNALVTRSTAVSMRDELVSRLLERGLTAVPVLELGESTAGGFAAAARHAMSMEHPFGVHEVLVTPPWDIDGERPAFSRRAPLLGEHDETVLGPHRSSGGEDDDGTFAVGIPVR